MGVTKKYGKAYALDGVDLEIGESGIYCLLGRNGAGKTTLLKSIAGHQNITSGEIVVNGARVSTINMPTELSFMEAQTNMFNLRLRELIKYSAKLSCDFNVAFAEQIAQKFKLDLRKKYRQLSFGMKTMFSTLLSLAGGNKIVILDEPVLGLDAIMRAQFYTLLRESSQAHPRIIIVSTHLIDEIAKVTDKIIIIDNGKVLDYFAARDLKTSLQDYFVKLVGGTEI